MWELDHKESWVLKNWCFWTLVLEKTLDCYSDGKEIKPVNPKGNQLWIFIGRTDDEAEAPILQPPDEKCQLIRKDPDSGKNWGQEKGMTEVDMVLWHHQLDGHEFEQDDEGQGGLACCSPWGHKELDTTEGLNWTELNVSKWHKYMKQKFSLIKILESHYTFFIPLFISDKSSIENTIITFP